MRILVTPTKAASLAVALALTPAVCNADEPYEVPAQLYAEFPWNTLPPGGANIWHPSIVEKWTRNFAGVGQDLLAGQQPFDATNAEIVLETEAEARVLVTLFNGNSAVHTVNFGLVLEDEGQTWQIIEVFSDDGSYLSELLAAD